MKRLTTLASIAGLCTVVGLFMSSGLEDVSAAVVSAGWGAALVVVARLVAVAWAGLGWYVVFPGRARPSSPTASSLRFVREGINTLLPVATVGGDFVGARLLAKRGVTGALAGASMFVDLMTQALTQLLFTVLGLGLLVLIVRRRADRPDRRGRPGRRGAGARRLLPDPAPGRAPTHPGAAQPLRLRPRVAGASVPSTSSTTACAGSTATAAASCSALAVHLVGWVIGTLEVYVCLHFMGYPGRLRRRRW